MTTQRLQLPATNLSTGMWRQPRVKLWISCFATETKIPGRDGSLAVLATALRTAPGKVGHGLNSPWVKGTVNLDFRHLEDTILGPLLDTLNVEAAVALPTIPYRVKALYAINAYKANKGTTLNSLLQVLLGPPISPLAITLVHSVNDCSLLQVILIFILICILHKVVPL